MKPLLQLLSIVTCLFGITIKAQAQKNAYSTYSDNFDDNKKHWFIKDTKNWSYSLKDGYYFIQSKNEKSFGFDGKSFYINPRKNFELETAVTELAGTADNGSGIFWGATGRKNLYRFVVASKGYFCIGRYKRGSYKPITKWIKHEAVKTGFGVANVLKISKSNSGLRFYVNQKLVYTISPGDFEMKYPFMGNFVGLVAFWKKEAKFDYFKLTRAKYKINLIPNAKQGYKKEPLGDGINSEYNDILPKISPDGQTLYFVRQKHPGNIKPGKQDVWVATRKSDGTWDKAKNMGKPINNEAHNGVVAVSPDGNTLIVADVYNADGTYKKAGLSISHRTKDGWELPKEIKIKNYYNKNYYVARCISADRQKLILAVERNDSYGGMDLYICFLQNDGTWSAPKNMGRNLNTYGTEGEPFLAADNTTLYFSSNGHPGYGGSDIYVSRRLDETWTKWSKPQNLGPEVNSRRTDNSYVITAKGDYAYLLSYRNKAYRNDIFRIKLHKSARPKPVVMVYGKVLNRKTGKPLAASIRYNNLNTGKLAGVARSNPKDGTYKIVLPYDKVYDFLATRQGFYSVSNNLDLKNISEYKSIKRNLYLAPIIAGQKIRLNNLFFDTGKSELKPTSFAELNRLIRSLKRYPAMTIEVGGHTDTQGNAAKNMRLSKARANAVLTYLSAKGIARSRMKAKGYGQTKPIANNNSTTGRARNRRVEFTILKK